MQSENIMQWLKYWAKNKAGDAYLCLTVYLKRNAAVHTNNSQ